MNRDALIQIADGLLVAASTAAPGPAPTVALVRAAMSAFAALSDQLREVRDNPDTAAVWTQVEQDYVKATDAFRASVDRPA